MRRIERELLFPLADAIEFPLRITEKNSLERAYPKDVAEYALGSSSFPLQCEILSSGFGISTAWLLMRIRGDLGLLVGHDVSEEMVYSHVVDLSKVHAPKQHLSKTYRVVRDSLKAENAIVASYCRGSKQDSWVSKNGKNGTSVDRSDYTETPGITWIHTDKS